MIVDDLGPCVVNNVRLEVGEFAGVEPALFELAFAALAPQHLGRQATLEYSTVSTRVRCEDCGSQSLIDDFRFHCRSCAGTELRVVAGEDVRIVEIEVSDSESQEAGSHETRDSRRS